MNLPLRVVPISIYGLQTGLAAGKWGLGGFSLFRDPFTHCRAVYGLTIAIVCSLPGLDPASSSLLIQKGRKEGVAP